MQNRDLVYGKFLKSVTKQFRDCYYSKNDPIDNPYLTPFGGNITESIGPWPEFILKGRYCKKSLQGYCTPCFYSRFPKARITNDELDNSLLSQCRFIVENFEELVINNQVGKVSFIREEMRYQNKEPVAMVLTPTGSYFDNFEYPQQIRIKILSMLLEKSESLQIDIILHIESHVEDFISYDVFNKTSQEEIHLLNKLNTRIIFGFESINDYTRNVLYSKGLDIQDYELAVTKAKNIGLSVGSFVFAGISPMNNIETIKDLNETFFYLKTKQVSPVLMFHNIQPYTIQELLFLNNVHKLIDPRTVLEAVKMLVDIFGVNIENDIDSWLIADPIGGPPAPKFNIFNIHQLTCERCSERIYTAICELRISKNVDLFLKEYNLLKKCICYENYIKLIADENNTKTDIYEKTQKMIEVIKEKMDYYLKNLCPETHEEKEKV